MTYKILFAEDDEVTQEIVKSLLGGFESIDLSIANDGREALEAALKNSFDLMIIDQNMPHVNGDRVIRHLRAGNSANRDVKVIRFTAEVEVLHTPAPGSDDDIIMHKPIRGAEFVAVIASLMECRSNCMAIASI